MSEHEWLAALSHWLIRHAARRAPPDLSDRLAEEWRADCGVRASAMSQLRFALGCCRATRVIAREHHPVVPVAAVVIGSSAILGRLRDESGIFAHRSSMFFLVAGLHIALFYALMTGLAFRIIKTMPPSFQSQVLQSPQGHASTTRRD
jgi:hypothetical protein